MFYEFITTQGWWLLAVTCTFGAGMFYQMLRQDSSALKTRQALREAKAHIAARDETIELWRTSSKQKESEFKEAKAATEQLLRDTQAQFRDADITCAEQRATIKQLATDLQVMTAKFDAQLVEGNKLHDQVRTLQQDNCSMRGEHSDLVEGYNAMVGQLPTAPPGTYADMIRYSIAEITRAREENASLMRQLHTSVAKETARLELQNSTRVLLRTAVSDFSGLVQKLDSIASNLEGK